MPGPAPKPTKLKKLAGNPGRRPLNRDEPDPMVVWMYAPKHLPPAGKAEWRRILPELNRLGLFTVLDRAMLAAYCQSWADYLEAEEHIKGGRKVLISETGYQYQNPWLSIRNKSLEMMEKFCARFGLDPSSRSKIHIEKKQEQSLAEILFAGANNEGEND